MQATVKTVLEFRGRALHSGAPAMLRIRPYPAHLGIWFKRTDLKDRDPLIPARWDAVVDTRLCTVLANRDGASVSTVEHVMAALAAFGIDNALVEVDGPEVPILDGSSAPYARALARSGAAPQDGERQVLRILKPVEASDGERLARLEPASRFEVDFAIDFADPAIGAQRLRSAPTPGTFLSELADCRTFCMAAEIEAMRQAGLARGGSLDNAVVVDDGRVLNPEGLRRPDEFVRHKTLDAIGDLGLAPAPILGRYVGRRSGHEMTNRVLRARAARPDAWRIEAAEPARVAA
ncbi:MAG: UDP-3-O-acyl-N-acetylglucosamine deacetylase [Pseudomonadota bacterium]